MGIPSPAWLFDASLRSDGVHALEHLAYLATAVLFWMPIVGRDPTVGLRTPLASSYLFFAMASMAFLGLALLSANHVLHPTYAAIEGTSRAVADQRWGGGLMWPARMINIVPALALVMLDWMRADDQRGAGRTALGGRQLSSETPGGLMR